MIDKPRKETVPCLAAVWLPKPPAPNPASAQENCQRVRACSTVTPYQATVLLSSADCKLLLCREAPSRALASQNSDGFDHSTNHLPERAAYHAQKGPYYRQVAPPIKGHKCIHTRSCKRLPDAGPRLCRVLSRCHPS